MPDDNAQADPTPNADAPQSVEAVLTSSDLDDLFRDLAACAEVLHIAVRDGSHRANADPVPVDLVRGRLLLDQAQVHALQLRYRYNGWLWIDTLTKRQDGYHLLRVSH